MLTLSAAKPAYRWILFLGLLLSEILTITYNIDLYRQQDLDLPVASRSIFALFVFIKDNWRLGCWILAGCFISITPHLKPVFIEYIKQIKGYVWYKLLSIHLLFFAAFLILSTLIFTSGIRPDYLTAFWFVCWMSGGVIAFILLLLTLAPSTFWLTITRRYRINLLAGALLGILTNAIFDLFARQEAPLAQQALWTYLSGLTLQITYSILKLVFADNELIYEPDSMVIGTDVFPVEITYACSGIEGVSLITGFLAVYLFLFHKQLHFPAVLWLFPIGIIAIWFTNAIRIALLVILGHFYSAEVAGSAFHAQAGWIAFTLIAVCLIVLVHRMRIFSRFEHQRN
ncbi:MAG: archaeosortase/exosortase family protein [Methylococcaceae bacterium]|nr:archaeosortase/exosortase family protein [Methylococcaceae bacterium]